MKINDVVNNESIDEVMPIITKIQKFCTHDGPGIRTTIFFKGCPLRCRWCHNPETQKVTQEFYYSSELCIGCEACAAVCKNGCHKFEGDIHKINRSLCIGCMRCTIFCPPRALEACGEKISVEKIMNQVLQDKSFYGDNGGITLSGGEPLIQINAAIKLLRTAKEEGLNTAVETCGYFDSNYISELSKLVDLFLYDYKDSNPLRHKEYTGVDQELILKNLRLLDEHGCKIRLRCIMVANVNMEEAHFLKICEQYHSLHNCDGVELLPYHQFGGGKNILLGEVSGSEETWIPSKKAMDDARKFLRKNGVRVI